MINAVLDGLSIITYVCNILLGMSRIVFIIFSTWLCSILFHSNSAKSARMFSSRLHSISFETIEGLFILIARLTSSITFSLAEPSGLVVFPNVFLMSGN